MKSYQLKYTGKGEFKKSLKQIKKECKATTGRNVNFCFTWTDYAKDKLKHVTQVIEDVFPGSYYYGSEASGNILQGKLDYGIAVTCNIFEDKETKSKLIWVEEGTEIPSLSDLWDYCKKEEGLKAVELIPSISYLEKLKINNNIPDIPDDIPVFGGASVNYHNPSAASEIMASGHDCTSEGMAAVLYYGDNLNIYATYILGWKGLGRLMKVNKSHGKIINEIDGLPARAVYEKYLDLQEGEEVNLIFPLIVEEDGFEYIRTPQYFLPDKSMSTIVEVTQGSMARIAYGDKNTILNSLYEKINDISASDPQVIKTFSCAGRKYFWGDDEISKETLPLLEVAPAGGFYTGGEILRFGNKLKILNSTLVIVGLREGRAESPKQLPLNSDKKTDRSLISSLTHFAEKIVEEQEAQRNLAEGLEKAFASQYQVIYHLNLLTQKATFVRGDEDAMNFLQITRTNTTDNMIANFIKYYVDRAVVKEDRERVKSVMNLQHILSYLKTHNSISVNFRVRRNLVDPVYTEMRLIKAGETNGELSAIILTIKLTDEELLSALEQSETMQKNIMNEMLGDDGLFLIDCVKDTRKTIHDNCDGADNYDDHEVYSELIKKYVNNCVAEIDREMMLQVTSPQYMLERLKKEKEFTIEYRDITTGVQHFYRMKVAKFSETEVLQSFSNKDKEIIDRMMLEKMEEDYLVLLCVDLDEELIQIMKKSDALPIGEIGEVIPYSALIERFDPIFKGESRNFFNKLSDIESLKRSLATEDRLSYTYKSNSLNGEKWISASGIVLERHDDGNPSLFSIGFSFADALASEKQELQDKLKEALSVAEIANKSKTNFLFNMSHDIRTPMNAITGFTAMAKKYVEDKEKVTDYLEKIDISSQQLLTLINQVLEMSRIESGKIEFNNQPTVISEKYESMVTVLSAQAKTKGIEFNYSLDDIVHNNVLADEARMGQITLNIAGNALKYTPEGGRVDFTLKEVPCDREGWARYTYICSDNGIGMSKEFLKVLFEPFTREKSSTVSHIQGTGLGMSIVKSLVDLLGGTIDVKSELGKGTRFEITVELKIDETAAPSENISTNFNSVSFEGLRLLLVEDNEMNREIAKDILEEQGLIVEEASDGDIAVQMVRDIIERGEPEYYDFILMDIQMPRMNGYDATKAIRAIPVEGVHIPIIAMTANAFEEDRLNALAAGMDEHVAKPVDIQRLFGTLARFL